MNEEKGYESLKDGRMRKAGMDIIGADIVMWRRKISREVGWSELGRGEKEDESRVEDRRRDGRARDSSCSTQNAIQPVCTSQLEG